VLACFQADALSPWSLGSLADALPPLLLLNARSLGGCFVTAVWSVMWGTIARSFLLQAQL
jgi:hypothetical protein